MSGPSVQPVLLCACLAAGLLFDPMGFLRMTLVCAFVHESGHVLAYMLCAHKLPGLHFSAGGIGLSGAEQLPRTQELWVLAAGPLANFIMAALLFLQLHRQASYALYFLAAVSLCTGVYNLMPFGVLDGARLLQNLLPVEKQDALRRAQQLGFAESDPSFDIEGWDALFKLIIITVHALGRYVAPERIFTYGISRIGDFDIRYAREKRVKIKLVAQVVKVSDEQFTMFVMPEFVGPSKYIYSVDDEYNGVVIRGECYDRQFMFGKGAGSLPTASSILSDVMALRHDYRYEYKKMSYVDRPDYTTDVVLRVYVRYTATDVRRELPFTRIIEQFQGETANYVIAEIKLSDLIACRQVLSQPDVFIANIPMFFIDRDN